MSLRRAASSFRTRTRTRRRKYIVPSTISAVILGLSLAAGLLILAEAASEHVIPRQANEEEVELLRPSIGAPPPAVAAAAAAGKAASTSKPTSSKISSSSMKKPVVQQQKPPHIYRIRAAPMNGNLAPPIKVLPNQHQTSFGVRAPSPQRTSANLQQQIEAASSSGTNCAKAPHDEQESAASSSSISTSSQVLRLLANGNNSSTKGSSIVQRLGEIEEVSQSVARQSILLANQSSEQKQQQQQQPTTDNSILNLIDEYDSKIITNNTRAQLSCDSGEMILRLNFSEPFKGIVYPDNNRLSPCRFFGDGHHNYELRLPLRGCGTKQVAQRVFVNDVIVRFHKSLELEEDEVKTLICRYPPPLTSAAQRPSTQQQGEQENVGQNQFEFIEQGRQPSGSDNIAPPGGHQSSYGGTVQELVPSGAHNGGRLLQSHSRFPSSSSSSSSSNGRPSADLIDQRSSSATPDAATFNNIGGQSTRATSGGLAAYFERLSSIELLFLISSLMFLVLLGLGLAGGYLCFRRQAANERQASAILRRKRRFLGSSGLLGPPPTSGGLLQQPAPPFRAHHHHYYQQQQHQQRRHHQQAPPSASSPESDLSGRGLLRSTGSEPHYMFTNQAFMPDSMPMVGGRSSRHKAGFGGPVPPPKPVVGRRGELSAIYGQPQGPVAGRHSHHHRVPPSNCHHAHLHSMNDVSSARYGRSSQGLHRAQQVFVEQEGEPRELSRAKSLTCVPQQRLPDHRGGRRQWQPVIGGTLARYQHRPKSIQQQQQQHGHRQHYLAPLQSSKHRVDQSAWLQVSSDSEIEPNNNNNNNNNTKPLEPKGKLFLKSIEDSYITKFTEIEENEYTKRDSLRPFGLLEWRQKIAEQRRRQRESESKQADQSEDASSYKSSSSDELPPAPLLKTTTTTTTAVATTTTAPSSPEVDCEYRSTNANLRSLTELDVNFAKSLLRSARPNVVVSPSLQNDDNNNNNKGESPKPEADSNHHQDEDDGLVVSPEYEVSSRRLELADEPTGASGSRNSVSYV